VPDPSTFNRIAVLMVPGFSPANVLGDLSIGQSAFSVPHHRF
jgi:hypothetical protein